MPVCDIATAQELFDVLAHELESNGIPWSNVIGFSSDRASVMVEVHHSVLSRVCSKQPKVFTLGCLCHLAALCAVSALKKIPLSIDNLLIDIFYHFKHSSKRWTEFVDILAEFSEIKPLKVLKHCTTPRLSLQHCIRRLLEQWPTLFAYFDRQVDIEPANDQVCRVASHMQCHL